MYDKLVHMSKRVIHTLQEVSRAWLTAVHHHYPYPNELDENVSTYIQTLFEAEDP